MLWNSLVYFGLILVNIFKFNHFLVLVIHFGLLLLGFCDFKFVFLLNERGINHFKTFLVQGDDGRTNTVFELMAEAEGWIVT